MARLKSGYSRRKDGMLQLRFTYDGKRHYVYGHSYQECETKKLDLIDKIKNHMLSCNDKITLSEYYVEWQRGRELQITDSTRYTNDQRWARMEPLIGKEKVAKIETRHIINMRNSLAKSLSPTTVNDEITLLNSIMESAIEDKIRLDNPCRSKSIKPLPVEVEATDTYHRALTLEEQALFFKAAKECTWYYELLVFMIATGCRVGEVGALKWTDIDYRENVVHINKTISRISHNDFVIKNRPKTKKSIRDIPLNQTAKEALQQQKKKSRVLDIGGNIFMTTDGGIVHKSHVNAAIAHVLKKMKKDNIYIERFTSHALRATFATRAIEQGMTPQTLKTILGHSSIRMTMDLYAHVLPNTKQEEMGKVEIVV